MADLCPECGANPCYGICPLNDPYHGDQAAENADYEANARYDDVRERYAATAEDADLFYAEEYTSKAKTGAEYELRRAVVDSVSEESPEGFRPNDDGTVTYISPTGGEHTYDPDQVFRPTADDLPF